ncbi:uncharacterized protein LOC142645659 [Dermatophagoides pteronyssinus]|uniref:uncharacterized protein LOC142645659 n=1 Tax=Dermatophagoides pteronyssinus TaxID=6956 RepID=UPI003F66C3FA
MTNEIDLNVDVNDDMIIIDDRNDDDDDQDDIYEKIRKQIGFYFSLSNIYYDKFMQRLIGIDLRKLNNCKQDYEIYPVYLKEFLRFNKIRELTNSFNDLLNAFDKNLYPQLDSFLLKNDLHYDSKTQSLQRCKPYNLSINNLNNRTIYLEGFNPYIKQIDNKLRCLLEKLGPILSLRLQKRSQSIGFAFIEYEHEENAKIICQWFDDDDNDGDKLSTKFETKLIETMKQIEQDLKQIKHQDYQIRILSKKQWNHYKNRYLRIQRRCRTKSLKREKELLKSFELQSNDQQQSSYEQNDNYFHQDFNYNDEYDIDQINDQNCQHFHH